MAQLWKGTAAVLATCGWQVGTSSATRTEGKVVSRVWADGRWRVTNAGELVKEGHDAHPANAAMDANEIAWALRPKLWAEG